MGKTYWVILSLVFFPLSIYRGFTGENLWSIADFLVALIGMATYEILTKLEEVK